MLSNLLRSFVAGCVIAGPLAMARPGHDSSRTDALKLVAPIQGMSFRRLEATRAPCKVKTTNNFQTLRRMSHQGAASRTAPVKLGAFQRLATPGEGGYQNISVTSAYGVSYAVEAVINGSPVNLLVDTASSDTWTVRSNYTCIDYSGNSLQQASCGFGRTYPQTFQYGLADGVHLFIQYGDGEMVSGPMGFSDITLANITVKKQQIALVNQTYWLGDNYTSGILGLGYPSITNAFTGNSFDHATYQSVSYPPVFSTMVQQGLVEPVFSLAISRNSSEGVLGWGGIPASVSGLDYTAVAYADIIIANILDSENTAWDYSFYTIVPDGVQYGRSTNRDKYPFIVDSGTTVNYFPPPLADAINAAFDPPARYLYMYGGYFTECNAIPPPLSIVIGGASFAINPKDMILQGLLDPLTGLCMTSVNQGGSGPYVLGDAFLLNVLAVFDIGAAEMQFIGRAYY